MKICQSWNLFSFFEVIEVIMVNSYNLRIASLQTKCRRKFSRVCNLPCLSCAPCFCFSSCPELTAALLPNSLAPGTSYWLHWCFSPARSLMELYSWGTLLTKLSGIALDLIISVRSLGLRLPYTLPSANLLWFWCWTERFFCFVLFFTSHFSHLVLQLWPLSWLHSLQLNFHFTPPGK